VSCNQGKNASLKVGTTFTCTADQSETFTVTIRSGGGDYEVVKNG
jgi:hypothetical protein